MDYDWSTSNRPVWFGELSTAELRRQIASHEAGHAVVGVGLEFALDHITLGLGEEQIAPAASLPTDACSTPLVATTTN